MESVHIKDISLNDAYFHFTLKENLDSISKVGLLAKCGDASALVFDKPRVCFSYGAKGMLGIKNSFLYEFKNLRVCDIPNDYRKYFTIDDFSSSFFLEKEQVYDAFYKRLLDECYLLVRAKEGEDFLEEEVFGLTAFDIKGIENHSISVHKLSLIISDRGNSALDILAYVFSCAKNVFSFSEMEDYYGDLVDFFNYLDFREEKQNIRK